MATNDTGTVLANAIGVMMGLLVVGLIVYMIGVKVHLWQSSSTGFWTF
jgi:hypothetical protein